MLTYIGLRHENDLIEEVKQDVNLCEQENSKLEKLQKDYDNLKIQFSQAKKREYDEKEFSISSPPNRPNKYKKPRPTRFEELKKKITI